jgi:molybdenum cofactor cytidylyltransferase
VAQLDSIVLCAGGSRRLGTPKQALTLHGETLLCRAVRLAGLAGAVRTHVISGAHARDDAAALAETGATVHVNQHWQSGMASSLAHGAQAVLAGAADAALIMLVDQYRLDSPDLARLVAAWRPQPTRPVAARYAGVSGVPAILPRAVLETLARRGLRGREWFAQHVPATVDVPAAAYDIDTPGDVAIMRSFEHDAG